MSLAKSATSGSRLDALHDLRDLLARSIEDCESMRDLAALSGRLQAVLAEIDELSPTEQEVDAVDEIAKRRDARRSGAAKGSSRAKRSS